jgi:subtilase family serine protease
MPKTTFSCSRHLGLLFLAASAMAAPKGAVDRGPLAGFDGRTPISVTVSLALPGLNEAESLQRAIYTPGDPQFHHFLNADQFAARFAASDADVAKVVAALGRYGLAAHRATTTTLRVTGRPADIERAFSVSLHRYEVAPEGKAPGYSFHAPAGRAVIPAEISANVTSVLGLDNRPVFHSHLKARAAGLHVAPGGTAATKTGHAFGSLTVTDFANQYDVGPLYSAGVTGSGRTIGIITLAAFTPSDAYEYWAAVGLNVAANRITTVDVDGGPGAPSDASGSDETTLDVEQAGGIAPGAKIIVYQAPNTSQAFLDAFAAAIASNTADSLSTSWGDWEAFSTDLVTGPGGTAPFIEALHELLLQAAIQGQTVFAASGDGGAYDVNQDLGCNPPYSPSVTFSCSATLSVDYPASDPLITAAGGTTLAGHQEYCLNAACSQPYLQVQTPQESVWGWDYLTPLCAKLGFDPIGCGIFPAGSGGGVSVLFGQPSYQAGIPGMQLSQPGQALYLQPYGLLLNLPANVAGRNVPDISFNADPQTGYVVLYTSDVTGLGTESLGGTSFVAPQLNGVTALLAQYAGQRVGFLNPALYGMAASGKAYSGTNSPLRTVAFGDNWFYSGTKAYNPGSGLGTLDVYNFAVALRGLL